MAQTSEAGSCPHLGELIRPGAARGDRLIGYVEAAFEAPTPTSQVPWLYGARQVLERRAETRLELREWAAGMLERADAPDRYLLHPLAHGPGR